jgi:bifunctional UDP-N-acetylglucosamine pyrophosphorylase/glucosamine-1-phosphate N-acetyltransferase
VVKRSVIMSSSNAPHLNYVADSVISEGCNLGAGTKIANLRFDDSNVRVTIKGKRIDSGRRKLGAFIGYNVKTGINVSIYPGVKIGSDSWIEAGVLVRRDINA